MTRSLPVLCATLLFAGRVCGFQPAESPPAAATARSVTPFAATGSVQYGFSPHDSVDQMIIAAIDAAREQVLVQAFSFTHRRIGDALIRAYRRGIDVRVVADQEQSEQLDPAVLRSLARAGIPLLVDPQHSAAHNKVMVIDGAGAGCAVITGSYNFTYAAQSRNAENALVLRGNLPLCAAYQHNWSEHRAHSLPYRHR